MKIKIVTITTEEDMIVTAITQNDPPNILKHSRTFSTLPGSLLEVGGESLSRATLHGGRGVRK